jgi:hypothetical protein
MNKLTYKLTTGAATFALLATSMAPAAFADVTVSVSGNRRNSTNTATTSVSKNTSVNQTNTAVVNTRVNARANSGRNTANDNSGDVDLTTGKSANTVTVDVLGGNNTATMPDCECGDVTVRVNDNARGTDNVADTTVDNTEDVTQGSETRVRTRTRLRANSGRNRVNDTVGGGTVDIDTDDTANTVGVTVEAGVNTVE